MTKRLLILAGIILGVYAVLMIDSFLRWVGHHTDAGTKADMADILREMARTSGRKR